MKLKPLLFFLALFAATALKAQTVWQNPLLGTDNVLKGQLNAQAIGKKYQRLADELKDIVRTPVWNLAQNTAGFYIEFKTNATQIDVRYTTSGARAMPHMPSTGVAGLDLYVNNNNKWSWTPGEYKFKDTVTYSFKHIPTQSGIYRLYLPLYCNVTWLELGVDQKFAFNFIKNEDTNPIVVYGTSIAQGGCASRPGLAWTSIFGRAINQPVINLGFSGNGRLEQPIIDEMAKSPAKLYILDCMPNLGDKKLYPEAELTKRMTYAVQTLQKAQPNTPILIVEHSGGNTNQLLDTAKNEGFRFSSALSTKVYKALVAKGFKNLHLLTTAEIGLTSEGTVDGAHPNDIGMMAHGLAFEKAYKKIFKLK